MEIVRKICRCMIGIDKIVRFFFRPQFIPTFFDFSFLYLIVVYGQYKVCSFDGRFVENVLKIPNKFM